MGKIKIKKPKTCIEAVKNLEEFLCVDFGSRWTIEFIRTHFRICKNQIKKIHERKGK